VQPVPNVYVIVAVQGAEPTTPVTEPVVASMVMQDDVVLQVPPGVELVYDEGTPVQTVGAPDIAPGNP
jgi:hypothetical protein